MNGAEMCKIIDGFLFELLFYRDILVLFIKDKCFLQFLARNEACLGATFKTSRSIGDIGCDGFVLVPVHDINENGIIVFGIGSGNIQVRYIAGIRGVECIAINIGVYRTAKTII